MRVHIIRDGRVENTVIADSVEQAQAAFKDATVIEAKKGGPGWVYSDGDVFEPAPDPLLTTKITRLAFRRRLTVAERAAIEIASRGNNPSNAELKVYMDDVMASTFVDLSRPETIAGVQALEAAGVLAPGRANQILTAPVQPIEAFGA